MKKIFNRIPAFLLLNLLLSTVAYAKSPIVLTVKTIPGKSKPENISYVSMMVESRLELVDVQPERSADFFKYTINEEGPVSFRFNERNFIAEPGDNIVFETNGEYISITGKGAAKYQLAYLIDSLKRSITLPKNPKDHSVQSLDDFMEWNTYTKRCVAEVLPVIDSWKNKMSKYIFSRLRARFFNGLIDNRSDKFGVLVVLADQFGLSKSDICAIYDSTYQPFVSKLFDYSSQYVAGSWKPASFAVLRKFRFEYTSEEANTQEKRRLLFLEEGMKKYKNEAREAFVYKMLYKELVKDFGFTPAIEKALAAYYAEPGFPDYKLYMKEQVEALRRRLNAHAAPDFALEDRNNNVFSKQQFKGKLVLFDFWFSGCGGCVPMAQELRNLEQEFSSDTNLVFVSVSVDEDKQRWINSIARKKYTSGGGVQLYTGGRGANDSLIKNYGISGYPSMVLMDPYGRTINFFPFPDPRRDNGKKLREVLQTQLTLMKDGPYVIRDEKNLVQYDINGLVVTKEAVTQPFIQYAAGHDQPAKVLLKKIITEEPSEYRRPSRLLSFSDIEGNFPALKNLLKQNGVIDEQLNWTYGDGHLVFGGDMFDRGIQVTECLWLIYSLEEKAKAAGGYVHFVLGNHEIMNLQGDNRYNDQKYVENAAKLNRSLQDLYNENSELGKWLRSKNVIEKIGDLLFVHGGIGVEFSDSVKLTIPAINQLARKYYADKTAARNTNVNVRLIFDAAYGPLWFRQYYDDKDKTYRLVSDPTVTFTVQNPSMEELDAILSQYKVTHIITGHTIRADTISVHYNNKIINSDTPHAKGKSEALLIEGFRFYRVNAEGKKWLLFDDKL